MAVDICEPLNRWTQLVFGDSRFEFRVTIVEVSEEGEYGFCEEYLMDAVCTSVFKRVQKLYDVRLLPCGRVAGSETLEDICFLGLRCAFRRNNFQGIISTMTDEIQLLVSLGKTSDLSTRSRASHTVEKLPYPSLKIIRYRRVPPGPKESPSFTGHSPPCV